MVEPPLFSFGVRSFGADSEIQHLDTDGECHGEIDVAFGDVMADSVGDEEHADQDEECQRQHVHRWMAIDEVTDGASGKKHYAHRHDDGGNHDRHVLNHSHRRDDGIQREDDVEKEDLENHSGHRRGNSPFEMRAITLEFVVNLMRAFADQEKPSDDEDDVFSAHRMAKYGE